MTSTRHHFVPQAFLRGFEASDVGEKSHIWVYSKTAGRLPRLKALRSIAWLPSYYGQEDESGQPDDRLERELAQAVDNNVPPLIARLVALPGQQVTLDEDARAQLAYFVGLLMTRVPSFRDGIQAMHSWAARVMLSRLAHDDPAVARAVKQFGLTASAKPASSLEAMLSAADQIANSALMKTWQFFVPPPHVPLVTSDNPVHFSGGYAKLTQFGPAHPGAEIVVNLRHDLALVCTPRPDAPALLAFSLSANDARKFNRGTVAAARDRVFANKKSADLDRFVKKYANQAQQIIL